MAEIPDNVRLVTHPLADHGLARLRDATTDTETFRLNAHLVATLVALEALRTAPVRRRTVMTPLASTDAVELAPGIVFVPVLRAGLAMLEPCRGLLPFARVGFVGLRRDERTAIATEYYRKLPDGLGTSLTVVLDPMLATGGSMVATVSALRDAGSRSLVVACIVAAPEGLARLRSSHPDVLVVTAAVDTHLDDNAFIVPGLGDFGDRYFGA